MGKSQLVKHEEGKTLLEQWDFLEEVEKLSILERGRIASELKKDTKWRYAEGETRDISWEDFCRGRLKRDPSYISRAMYIYEVFFLQLGITKEELMLSDKNTLGQLVDRHRAIHSPEKKISDDDVKELIVYNRRELAEHLNPHKHHPDGSIFRKCADCGTIYKDE